jgi:predicted enzyme related to lactoylglutathione lyase
MAHPVTHFEVNAKDAKAMQRFYGDLFDWRIDTNNPMDYGMVGAQGSGIGGGIGSTQSDRSWITFYVESPDLAQTLAKAERLGGRTVMAPMDMGVVQYALFADPEGNVVGLAKSSAPARRARPSTARRTSAKRTSTRRSTSAKRTTKKRATTGARRRKR